MEEEKQKYLVTWGLEKFDSIDYILSALETHAVDAEKQIDYLYVFPAIGVLSVIADASTLEKLMEFEIITKYELDKEIKALENITY